MAAIAFYAPMKTPDDPVPSGDRTMARSLMTALTGAGLGDVALASRLRSRDGAGNSETQDAIFDAAAIEIARLKKDRRPKVWLTYHSYYKAPDLLGPALSRFWDIPYVLVEATRASKRLTGPYARFAAAAEDAGDAADAIFFMTEHDRFALERDRRDGQSLIRLRPFLGTDPTALAARTMSSDRFKLFSCAMMRGGDKLASYEALASALALVRSDRWTLTIAGDGPQRQQVELLFSPFGKRVTMLGTVESTVLADRYREADLFVWPGVGEAFGMAYLEAQAQGCPVMAEDRPGVRDVVRDGGWLVASDDPQAFAAAIDRLDTDRPALAVASQLAVSRIAADHSLASARRTLREGILPLLEQRR